MTSKEIQQRKVKRYFFSENDKVRAVFSFADEKKRFMEAKVLNLCESGLGLVVLEPEPDSIRSGEILRLRQVIGNPQLAFIRDIKSEIRWIVNHEFLDHVGFGCEFIDISAELGERIRSFISYAEEMAVSSLQVLP